MDERRLELQVGALLVAGVVALVALFWLMGDLSLSQKPALTVLLTHTGNVAEGAPVKLGGVGIGKVEKISLDAERRDEQGEPLPVVMALSIDPKILATLHADTEVLVATRGPLGEAYLELYPGSKDAPPLPDGATLRANDPARLDLLAARFSKMMDAAAKTLEDNPAALANLIGGVSKLSNNMGEVLGENRAELKALIGELGGAAKELRELAQHANTQLQPGGKGAALIDDASASAKVLRKELPALTANGGKAMAGLAALSGDFTAEDGKKLKAAIDKYSAAGDKLDQLAARGERILARVEAGQGTLGGVVKDDQLYKDLRDLVADLKAHPWKLVWKQ